MMGDPIGMVICAVICAVMFGALAGGSSAMRIDGAFKSTAGARVGGIVCGRDEA